MFALSYRNAVSPNGPWLAVRAAAWLSVLRAARGLSAARCRGGFRAGVAPRPCSVAAIAFCLLGWCVAADAVTRYVNPAHAAASDTGQGTSERPFRTIGFAMTVLQPGDRLEIAAGTYREAMVFPDWSSALGDTSTVIEGKGRVIIKGSVLATGWTTRGTGRFVKSWAKEPSQVFIDGVALQQIGGTILGGVPTARQWPGRVAGDQQSMPLNSFYFEALAGGGGNLHVRVNATSLAGRMVEVSSLPHGVIGKNLRGVTLRNLEFTHGNTSNTDRNGFVLMQGERLWLDRIKVSRVDTIGIELDGDDNRMTYSSSNDNGQLGFKGRGNRVQLIGNDTSRNNQRRFIKWTEAGGAKFVGGEGLRNGLVKNHRAIGNLADGIWFDWHNDNVRIEGGVFAYNTGFGIHYEASHRAVIVDNVAVGNGQRGIYLLHSAHSTVAFNLVAGNGLQGIVVVDEGARDPTGEMDLTPVNNKVFANLVAWNNGALVLPADLRDNASNWNVYVGPLDRTHWSLGWSNVIHRLPDWVAQSGQDRNSTYTVSATDVGAGAASTHDTGPYVRWARDLRARSAPLAIDPTWLARLGTARSDRRPGPNL